MITIDSGAVPTEHLDFMGSWDVDWEVQAFQQLQHASIGYQSLTDVPQAIAYSEGNTDFAVSFYLVLELGVHFRAESERLNDYCVVTAPYL